MALQRTLGRQATSISRRSAAFSGPTLLPHRVSPARAPRCASPNPAPTRRELLGTAGSLWLLGQSKHSYARPATAVFQEISVQLPATEDASPEPIEHPPTFVKATGRIVASACELGHCGCNSGLGELSRGPGVCFGPARERFHCGQQCRNLTALPRACRSVQRAMQPYATPPTCLHAALSCMHRPLPHAHMVPPALAHPQLATCMATCLRPCAASAWRA